jgi:hypothetical protein
MIYSFAFGKNPSGFGAAMSPKINALMRIIMHKV